MTDRSRLSGLLSPADNVSFRRPPTGSPTSITSQLYTCPLILLPVLACRWKVRDRQHRARRPFLRAMEDSIPRCLARDYNACDVDEVMARPYRRQDP